MEIQGINILMLAQSTGVDIKKSGRLYEASCPFHPDNTPSLKFYPLTNSFYCFGCGTGGDVVNWVMAKFNYDAAQAFHYLEVYAPELATRHEEPRRMPPTTSPIFSLEMIEYWSYNLRYTKQDEWFYRRGFTDETIDRELFGWNGDRFVIPVWEGQPGNSRALTLRLRRTDEGEGPKYLTPSGSILNNVWGKWHTRNSSIIIMTAGELDAARLVQDGMPAISLVGGMGAFRNFLQDWPRLWFPKGQHLLVLFDHSEAGVGGLLAQDWARVKGPMTADVIHWLYDVDDYNEFRMTHTKNEFLKMAGCQSSIACSLSQF